MAREIGAGPEPAVSKALQQIPNVGPRIAEDLIRLGVRSKAQLARCNPRGLYEELCILEGTRVDPCVWDVFEAAVAFARGEPALPWWEFSRLRKASAASEAIG